MMPQNVFFFKIVLVIPIPLPFPINFRTSIFKATENSAGTLIGILLSLSISLGRPDIFTVLSLLIHEHGCPFIYSDQHTSPIHVLLDLYQSLSVWGKLL